VPLSAAVRMGEDIVVVRFMFGWLGCRRQVLSISSTFAPHPPSTTTRVWKNESELALASRIWIWILTVLGTHSQYCMYSIERHSSFAKKTF
jgi:hypothetical protein